MTQFPHRLVRWEAKFGWQATRGLAIKLAIPWDKPMGGDDIPRLHAGAFVAGKKSEGKKMLTLFVEGLFAQSFFCANRVQGHASGSATLSRLNMVEDSAYFASQRRRFKGLGQEGFHRGHDALLDTDLLRITTHE